MATTMSIQHRPRTPRRAFSLVEVCLALGVVSFSIISLIALLPSSLNILRESKDKTIHAQIVQRVSGNLATADFANLSNDTLYFDDEGQPVGATAQSDACYVVTLQEELPSLPGLTDTTELASFANHLRRIRVGIARANVPQSAVEWYAIQVAHN